MLKPSSGFQLRSQSVFVLVAAGATLSLNDFLTFPILAGQNGGGAFLLLYVLILLLMVGLVVTIYSPGFDQSIGFLLYSDFSALDSNAPLVIFSYNVWNHEGFTLALFFADEAVRLVKNAGFDDIVIFISSHLIQPFAALMLCLLVAWVIPPHISYRRPGFGQRGWFEIWHYLLRYVAPVLLLVVTLVAIGVI